LSSFAYLPSYLLRSFLDSIACIGITKQTLEKKLK